MILMKLYLTKGMFGKPIEEIGNESNKVKTIIEQMTYWKQDEKNKSLYKIESYDRLIFGENSIVIDFGDYSYFLEITDVNEDLKEQFKGV